jgi:hypothetical protein
MRATAAVSLYCWSTHPAATPACGPANRGVCAALSPNGWETAWPSLADRMQGCPPTHPYHHSHHASVGVVRLFAPAGLEPAVAAVCVPASSRRRDYPPASPRRDPVDAPLSTRRRVVPRPGPLSFRRVAAHLPPCVVPLSRPAVRQLGTRQVDHLASYRLIVSTRASSARSIG